MENQSDENLEKISKRVCTGCGEEKDIKFFPIDKRGLGGRRSRCLKCTQARKKEWKKRNPDKVKKYREDWLAKEVDHRNDYYRKYNLSHPEVMRSIRKKYYDSHKKEIMLRGKEWKKKNIEKSREYARDYSKRRRIANREEELRKQREWCAKQRLLPEVKLKQRISAGVRRSLKSGKNGYSWELLLGFTNLKLKKHLEKQFLPGMTWENMGEWHIDHKVPVSAHNIKTANDIDFKKCWALKNLRPMWKIDNIKKGAKLLKPHQPALISGL